jgi:hypothetical protein
MPTDAFGRTARTSRHTYAVLYDLLKDPILRALALPIVVAILTTVAVEYLAKPTLEARKARLIRDRQQFDEVIFGFQTLVLSMASMLRDSTARENSQLAAVQRQQAADAIDAAGNVTAAMGRLLSPCVEKHREHVSRTMTYVGFVRGALVAGSSEPYPAMDYARSFTPGLSSFDAYFVAFATLRDSQPALIKRAFSRAFMRSDYRHDASTALKAAGLDDPVAS